MATKNLKVTLLGVDDTKKAFGSAGKNAEGLGDKMKRYGKVAGVAFTAAAGVTAIAGKALFEHGAELQQMGNKAETVFGGSLKTVQDWAKANHAAMGLTSRQTTGLAANFADLLIPMGFTREAAANMSTDVVGLSGALSQWSGGQKSAAEVSQILAKAMLGETDGLKELGISLSAADIAARLAANGQSELTGAALEQAKAQAVQALIMEKSTDAQAAYANGGAQMLSAGSQVKAILAETYDELAVKLIPAFTTAASWAAEKLPLAFETVKSAISKVVEAFRGGGQGTGELAKRFEDLFARGKQVFESLRQTITVIFDGIKVGWQTWGQTITEYLDTTFKNVMRIIEGALKIVRGVIQTVTSLIKGDWSGAWDGIKLVLSGAWDVIKGVVDQALNVVKTYIKAAMDVLVPDWRQKWEAIKTATSAALDRIVQFVTGLPGRAVAALSTLASKLGGAARTAFDEFRVKASAKADEVMTLVTGIPGRITRALGDLGSLLARAGRELISGLIGGINDKMRALRDKMSAVASTIKDFLPGSPIKEGPLTSWNNGGAGKRLMGMLAGGIEDASDLPARAMARAVDFGDLAGMKVGGTGYINSRLGVQPSAVGPSRGDTHIHLHGQIERLSEERIVTLMQRAERLAGY
jgi:hypothetical protein